MATSSMVPYSNPAGNNQTTPGVIGGKPGIGAVGNTGGIASTVPGATMGTGAGVAANPFIPASASPGSTTVPTAANAPPTTDPNQLLQKQLIDIAGKGVGGSEASLYSGMAGTESDIFKQFQQSMLPVQAQEKADFATTMGAAGVSPNSTVSALGLSNLEAKDFATEAGVDAQLMQQNQQNQLGILQNMQGAAEQEVASSGWDVFAQVAGAVGNLAAPFTGGLSGTAGKLFSGGGGDAASKLAANAAGSDAG